MPREAKPRRFELFFYKFLREPATTRTRDEAVKLMGRRAYDEGRFAALHEIHRLLSDNPAAWNIYLEAKQTVADDRAASYKEDQP